MEDKLWYKDAIIYELHIKAFHDSNSDGIGDFKGLLQKMDYLHDLGVTAIWLLPFYPSPQRDGGYDIADYYSINPDYGTLKDFKKLLKKARKLGMKVITELVLNHTSDQHPWFQKARNAPKDSPERDWYVWSDSPDKYKGTRIIFQDFEASNWTWDPVAQQYFWHRFYSHQPDLNFENPEVQQEVLNIIHYWCEMGVDGFRLDAIPYLFERDGTNCENLPETHVFLKSLRKHVEKKYPNVMFLAEANMWPEEAAAYFGEGDECHMNYHFPIMPRLFMSMKMEDRYPITDIIEQTPTIPENCQWAMFLRNHDELTLEMVTDEERDYMYRAYNKEDLSKINLGIRHRLAPLMDNDRRKIELMNYLLFSLPGTPVIYYGDEIGMGDNIYLGDRDGVRTPMQWNADRNGGFSTTNPQKLYLPTVTDPEYNFEAVNVETQENNLSSLLWFMRRVIAMRKRYKAFSRGTISFLSPENAKVLSFVRSYQDENILVLGNLSRFSQAIELDLSDFQGYTPIEVFSQNKFPRVKKEPYIFTLGAHGYYWMFLEASEEHESEKEMDLPEVALKDFSDLLNEQNLVHLQENVLPTYFKRAEWFHAQGKTILGMEVKSHHTFKIPTREVFLLFVDVFYNEGFPETYQLAITHMSENHYRSLHDQAPPKLIAKGELFNRKVVYYDALYNPEFQHFLARTMSGKKLKALPPKFKINAKEKFTEKAKEAAKQLYKVTDNDRRNTSIFYGNVLFLKFYRRLDKAVNPDAEVLEILSTEKPESPTPTLLGTLLCDSGKKIPYTILSVQDYVANQGTLWDYFSDSVIRFQERILQEEEKKIPTINFLEYPIEEGAVSGFEDLVGTITLDRLYLLGKRVAEFHRNMKELDTRPGFESEDFSLHYQRSLFSSLQSITRQAFQKLERNLDHLSKEDRALSYSLLSEKSYLLEIFKRIHSEKMDALKIRTHGDLRLEKVQFTGKDFCIFDFEGEHFRTFSEQRLKRSPLRDVAAVIRSFHNVSYSGIKQQTGLIEADRLEYLQKWTEAWFHFVSSRFLSAYLDETKDLGILPPDPKQFRVLFETFLMEKALREIEKEIDNNPDWVKVPVKGVLEILENIKGQ